MTRSIRVFLVVLTVQLAGCDTPRDAASSNVEPSASTAASVRSGYASIGPLRMYYEIHGSGEPVALIHGAVSTIDTSFGTILPELAKHRRLIAIESQGHSHTADMDRPLTFEQMADDAAALLRHLEIARTDVVGYSDGGNVALAMAMRHPEMVRKLAVLGTNYNNDGLVTEVREQMETGATQAASEVVKGIPPQFAKAYAEIAPDPSDWPSLVSKIMTQGAAFEGWTPAQMWSVSAPTLVVIGDRDIIRPGHAVRMQTLFRNARLAIIPGRDHISLVERSRPLNLIMVEFLNAPLPRSEVGNPAGGDDAGEGPQPHNPQSRANQESHHARAKS